MKLKNEEALVVYNRLRVSTVILLNIGIFALGFSIIYSTIVDGHLRSESGKAIYFILASIAAGVMLMQFFCFTKRINSF